MAISSVLEQSISDFELIVVDDGSEDDTAQIVADFDDTRIRYLWQPNAGRSAARNLGLSVASGEMIAFLDDDDRYLPDRLNKQLCFLAAHPTVGLVASGVRVIDEYGAPLREWRTWLDQPHLDLVALLYSCPLIPNAVLIRRSELSRLDPVFDVSLHLAEDVDLFLRLALTGCRFSWQEEIISEYRVHPESSQHDGSLYAESLFTVLSKLSHNLRDLRLASEIENAYAHHLLLAATLCLATNQPDVAGRYLLRCSTQRPEWFIGNMPHLVTAVAAMADSFRIFDAETYINYVFDNLPEELGGCARYRRKTLGALHAGRLFRSVHHDTRPVIGDFYLAIRNDIGWALNRGLWSIAVRGTFAPIAIWAGMRRRHFVAKYG